MAQGHVTKPLTVREAVHIIQTGPSRHDRGTSEVTVSLTTSFTPLHLEVLLRAYVQQVFPDRVVHTVTAPYGDLAHGIDVSATEAATVGAVVVEWQDLDPRLGRRESATAPIATPDEIVDSARTRLARIESSLGRVGALRRTVVSLPTLPLTPAYASATGRVDALRAALDVVLAEFVAGCERLPGIVLTRGVTGDALYDARNDAGAGHPYVQDHASRVARNVAALCFPAPAKKGVITDLDDTVWRGLVGEIGIDAVHWSLDGGSHLHAQYQQFLVSLAKRGVLIAIASKNDEAIVEKALARDDLLIRPEHYFPVVANWQPKSASVDRILKTWNIGASDVVFIDDSPVEVAEVERSHPGITGKVFPTRSAENLSQLLGELNELFWSESVSEEDSLRLESIRSSAAVDEFRDASAISEDFIASLEGTLVLDVAAGWAEQRALDLVNKTNQFNLNGRRFTAAEWREHCERADALNITAAYEDRFGRLGTISVLTGQTRDTTLVVDAWVLSCRAFTRGVEQQMLEWLLQEYDSVEFEYVSTPRNGPMTEFLSTHAGDLNDPRPRVEASADEARAHPAFPHITIKRGEP